MATNFTESRIVAFPFAGGNKHVYRPLADCLGAGLTMSCVELPGRGTRFSESLVSDLYDLAGKVIDPVLDVVGQQPFALFGHSMGALLAYLVARKLVARNGPLPRILFVSGMRGPVHPSPHCRHRLPRREFVDELRRIGGCPEEFLRNEDMLDLFLPVLQADFAAVERFRRNSASARFPFPITAFRGRDDPITAAEIAAWGQETASNLAVHEYPGGHFFLFDHTEAIADVMGAELAGLRQSVETEAHCKHGTEHGTEPRGRGAPLARPE